jgi:ubiquinone/menaquinone biosynthesis C-methylase UbiE
MDWHARYIQQASWTSQLRRHVFGRLDPRPGLTVLEVGCGTGAVLVALASELPAAARELHAAAAPGQIKFYGLDIDTVALNASRTNAPTATLTCGDAHHLPYGDRTFDLVCCHYLLLWLDDPLQALHEMQRVLRPGGWLAAFAEPDYGGRVSHPEWFDQLGQLQEQNLRRQGAETHMGRQLRSFFNQLDLEQVESGVLGAQWSEPASEIDMDGEWLVIEEDVRELLTKQELDEYRRLEKQSRRDGERVLFVPTFYAFGQKTA